MTNLGKIITIVVVILIIVGVVLLLVWYMKPKEEEEPMVEQTIEEQINQAISEYDFTMREYETVDKIKALGVEAIPYLSAKTEDDLDETRFIAYVSLSGLGLQYPEQKEAVVSGLKSGLDDQSDSLRVQAAQLLMNFGAAEGIPILIEELDNDMPMMPSEPPMNISEFAKIVLTEHTEQDFGYDKDDWEEWWEASKDDLEFDSETIIFK